MVSRFLSVRRVIAIGVAGGACGLIVATAGVSQIACQTHQCDGMTVEYGAIECPGYGFTADAGISDAGIPDGAPGCQGRLIDPDTWESNSTLTNWIDYGPNVTYNVTIPSFAGRVIRDTKVYLSTYPSSVHGGDVTFGSGNLAEIFYTLTDAGYEQPLTIYNDTCASYHARIVISAEPSNSIYSNPSAE